MTHTLKLWKYALNNSVGDLNQLFFDHLPMQLDEVSNQLPGGVYTTLRTYHKSFVLYLDDHIQRLEHSARAKGEDVCIDREIFRRNLRTVVQQHPAAENRIRVTLEQSRPTKAQIFLAVEDLITPASEYYSSGVHVLTTQMERAEPSVKDTDFIKQTKSLRGLLTNGVNEVLLVDQEKVILEGVSSNFFAVQENILITRQKGILPGITRKLVLEVAERANIAIIFSGVNLSELNSITEAFITSASRGVLPVVKIDQVEIGDGRPGRITQLLSSNFTRSVEELIEPI